MMSEKIRIGSTIIALDPQGLRFSDWPHPFYLPYRSQYSADISFRLELTKTLPEVPKSAREVFDGDFWKLYENGERYLFEHFDTHTRNPDKIVFFSKDFSRAMLYASKRKWVFDRLMRPALEILIVNYLASRGGLYLHASAVRDGDRTYAFVGASEAGKTTMAQFWGEKEGDIAVLNDEHIVIQQNSSGCWAAYGTPWPGMYYTVSGDSAPLAGIFFLKKGPRHEILSASPALHFQELFSQVYSSFWSREIVEAISGTCEQVIQEVPVHTLSFAKDAAVTDFIRESLHAVR